MPRREAEASGESGLALFPIPERGWRGESQNQTATDLPDPKRK